MKIIAFSGRAAVGKTTVVRELMGKLYEDGYYPVYLPFAAALKKEADTAGFGKEEDPAGYRKYCQNWGAKRRAENPDYWIERWVDQYEIQLSKENSEDRSSETVILVDDCRYINETTAIKDRGGKTIFIAGGNRTLVDEKSAWRKHESEALANLIEKTVGYKRDAVIPFCFIFFNSKSLEDLEDNLVFAYEDWLEETPCTCELCKSRRENRTPDMSEILKEVREILLSENIDPSEILDADAHDSDP